MSRLRALVEEVDAALEIHISARSDTRFNRTAFILADDCVELASKLLLMRGNPAWSDVKADGRFKNFKAVTAEVRAARADTADLLVRIEERRERRNGFFHSAHLLDLTLSTSRVDHALVDLLDYCERLFGAEWTAEVAATASIGDGCGSHPARPRNACPTCIAGTYPRRPRCRPSPWRTYESHEGLRNRGSSGGSTGGHRGPYGRKGAPRSTVDYCERPLAYGDAVAAMNAVRPANCLQLVD